MKVEVDVLGSPSLISLMVSADVKQHERKTRARWKIDPVGDVTCTESRRRGRKRLERGLKEN